MRLIPWLCGWPPCDCDSGGVYVPVLFVGFVVEWVELRFPEPREKRRMVFVMEGLMVPSALSLR